MPLPEVPKDVNVHTRNFLRSMREAVTDLLGDQSPLRPISNLQVTPIAGGNKIRFTKSNGESYTLFISASADISAAQQISLGTLSEYNDMVGNGGVARYYWVRADALRKQSSATVGPVSGTSLALTTTTTVPSAPPTYDPYVRTCFSGNTKLQLEGGYLKFTELPEYVMAKTLFGLRQAKIHKHEVVDKDMLDMGNGELVTLDHEFLTTKGWLPAYLVYGKQRQTKFTGTVYTLEVLTQFKWEQHFKLANGMVAHNKIAGRYDI